MGEAVGNLPGMPSGSAEIGRVVGGIYAAAREFFRKKK